MTIVFAFELFTFIFHVAAHSKILSTSLCVISLSLPCTFLSLRQVAVSSAKSDADVVRSRSTGR